MTPVLHLLYGLLQRHARWEWEPWSRSLRLLIVEDVAAEAELAIQQLKRAGLTCTWARVETEEALRTALRELRPHVVISDFSLPGYDGAARAEPGSE